MRCSTESIHGLVIPLRDQYSRHPIALVVGRAFRLDGFRQAAEKLMPCGLLRESALRLKPLPTTKQKRVARHRNPRHPIALVVGRAFRLDGFRQAAEKLMPIGLLRESALRLKPLPTTKRKGERRVRNLMVKAASHEAKCAEVRFARTHACSFSRLREKVPKGDEGGRAERTAQARNCPGNIR
jgi:hypothetical protein